MQHGYVSPRWATYKQWEQFGAQVRRGERGTRGVFWHVREGDTRSDVDPDNGRRSSWRVPIE